MEVTGSDHSEVITAQPERESTSCGSSALNCFRGCGVLAGKLYMKANTRSREQFFALERRDAVKNGFTAGFSETGCVQELFFDAFGVGGPLDYQLAVYEERGSYGRLDGTEECLVTSCCLPVQLMRRIGNCVAHCGLWASHATEPFCAERAKFYMCAICGECVAFPIEVAHTVTKVGCLFCACCFPDTIGPTKPLDSCPECLDRLSLFEDLTRRFQYPNEPFISTQVKQVVRKRCLRVSLGVEGTERIRLEGDGHLQQPSVVVQPVGNVEGENVGAVAEVLGVVLEKESPSSSHDHSRSSLTPVQMAVLRAVGSSLSFQSKGSSEDTDGSRVNISRVSSGLNLTLSGRRQKSGSSIARNDPSTTSGLSSTAPTRPLSPTINFHGTLISTV